VLVTIDREKAKVSERASLANHNRRSAVFMGSEYINDFDFNNRTYRVFVQADEPFRMTATDLHNYYVRSDSGQMVPLDNLVTVDRERGAAGDYALQSVPRGGGRWLPSAGLQLRPGVGGDGRSVQSEQDAGHGLTSGQG
jgi:hypothetical protein